MPAAKPRRLVYVNLSDLVPATRNARLHNLPDLLSKMERFGYLDPVIIDERTGRVVGGHGRMETLQEAKEAGLDAPEGVVVTKGDWQVPTVQGWASRDDFEADAANLALNPSPNDPGYDPTILAEILGELAEVDALEGTGHDADDLQALLASIEESTEATKADGTPRETGTGGMLRLVDVTFGEPDHEVHHGEVWTLGRHRLVIAQLNTEHALWRDFLVDDVMFAPYPDPYITTTTAAKHQLLLVQPNVFLAGHLLDKHASAYPKDKIVRVAP